MQKLMRTAALALTSAAALFMMMTPALAAAQNTPPATSPQTSNSSAGAACEGLALTGGSCTDGAVDPKTGKPVDTVSSTIQLVINILSTVVGVAAVIMIIIGGFKYITSSGDSNNISSAKNTILYAVIGLVIVALAQVLVRFVLNKTTKVITPSP